ncbi:hypothetical protein SAMN04488058_10240 [Deinococcus reticulitermitis]|uniref:Uncharacterized protein n=1 Tax=Deinococcus reticulitermitis TaxID=856736 RepID=A0A1H6U354_9DEIO|nr:hypothetical protein [Deinococcus reticulitermitis]SEI84944.1 hypothetical protein SAMN04488058_10240 [Deinococcus reticulitermitis]
MSTATNWGMMLVVKDSDQLKVRETLFQPGPMTDLAVTADFQSLGGHAGRHASALGLLSLMISLSRIRNRLGLPPLPALVSRGGGCRLGDIKSLLARR